MRTAPYPDVHVARASLRDADLVTGILEEAARWLAGRGIDQWPVSGFAPRVVDGFARGDCYLAWDEGRAVGTLSLEGSDETFWGAQPPDALYLHRLAVRRSHPGLGRWLVEWAEEAARAAGKTFLRLDCMAANRGLRGFYEAAGFEHCGDVEYTRWLASLYEKRVVGGPR